MKNFENLKLNQYSKDSKNKWKGNNIPAELIPQHVHHYEVFPYVYNSVVSMNGNIIDKQSFHKKGGKHKVIYNGRTTIVVLEDGTKGIAKCNSSDIYDKFKGYSIAYTRARIAQLQKELDELCK